jgi:hypothetical protein
VDELAILQEHQIIKCAAAGLADAANLHHRPAQAGSEPQAHSKYKEPGQTCVVCHRVIPTRIGCLFVTAPILRIPDEGTFGAEKHLEALLDKLLEEGGVKVTPLVAFRLLSHPLSHLGV